MGTDCSVHQCAAPEAPRAAGRGCIQQRLQGAPSSVHKRSAGGEEQGAEARRRGGEEARRRGGEEQKNREQGSRGAEEQRSREAQLTRVARRVVLLHFIGCAPVGAPPATTETVAACECCRHGCRREAGGVTFWRRQVDWRQRRRLAPEAVRPNSPALRRLMRGPAYQSQGCAGACEAGRGARQNLAGS